MEEDNLIFSGSEKISGIMATQRRRLSSIINSITKIPSIVIYLFFLFKCWVLGQIRRRGNVRRSDMNYIALALAADPITELPEPIMSDILSRLPLNSIFICRRVCKVWRNLLLEPHFAKLHLSRSPLSLFFYGNGHNTNSCSYFQIFEIDDPPRVALHKATITFSTGIYQPNIYTKIAALCNGSFLVSNCNNDEILIVCNPLRKQHFVLPVPPKSTPQSTEDFMTRLGLGYSPLTRQYKVLRLACTRSRARLDCHIFTIGIDDQWRRIGHDTGRTAHSYVSNVVFLNGALHWIGGTENSQLICYFDIEKEQFGSVPLPNSEIEKYFSIGVVDNRLYLDNLCYDDVWRFWVLKDYKDFGSWTLEWIIEGPFIKFNGPAKPLKMLKDGSLLMMFNNLIPRADAFKTTLASFNPNTRQLKEIEYGGILPWGSSYADVPCFYSPMDALKEQR